MVIPLLPQLAKLTWPQVLIRLPIDPLFPQRAMVNQMIREPVILKRIVDRFGNDATHLDGGVLDLGWPQPRTNLPAAT